LGIPRATINGFSYLPFVRAVYSGFSHHLWQDERLSS
jgi:hypothetical protein